MQAPPLRPCVSGTSMYLSSSLPAYMPEAGGTMECVTQATPSPRLSCAPGPRSCAPGLQSPRALGLQADCPAQQQFHHGRSTSSPTGSARFPVTYSAVLEDPPRTMCLVVSLNGPRHLPVLADRFAGGGDEVHARATLGSGRSTQRARNWVFDVYVVRVCGPCSHRSSAAVQLPRTWTSETGMGCPPAPSPVAGRPTTILEKFQKPSRYGKANLSPGPCHTCMGQRARKSLHSAPSLTV